MAERRSVATVALRWVVAIAVVVIGLGVAGGLRPAWLLGLAAAFVAFAVMAFRAARRLESSLTAIAGTLTEEGPNAPLPRSGIAEVDLLTDRVAELKVRILGQAEAADRQQRLRDAILDSLGEGVLLVDHGGNVAYVNEWLTGRVGDIGPVVGGIVPLALQRLVREALRGGPSSDVFEFGTPPRTWEAEAKPLGGGDVLTVVRDVTEQERTDAIRRDFAASASHELKTPIAGILAAAETVLTAFDDDPDAAKRFAEQVLDNAHRLASIVGDLLDLSRLEASKPVLRPVLLDQVVEHEAAAQVEAFTEAGVDLTVHTEPVTAQVAEEDMALAVRNLLENALRYTDPGGQVTVRLSATAEHAILEVVDTGIGIPMRERPRIFERFYRVDAARSRSTGGTGLGLAIVKHVAERHGGHVEVESQLGRGSTFQLRIPLDRSDGTGD